MPSAGPLPLGWDERPDGWRPRLGDRVTIAGLIPRRRRPADEADASRLIGRSGTVQADDRDGLPFKVIVDGTTEQGGFFMLEELVPAAPASQALQELPESFSVAPPAQLTMAGLLGAANLVGVLYLGGLLSSSARYYGSAAALVATLRRLYPALLAYGVGFVALPAARSVRVRRRNRRIEARNALRAAWGRAASSRQALYEVSCSV